MSDLNSSGSETFVTASDAEASLSSVSTNNCRSRRSCTINKDSDEGEKDMDTSDSDLSFLRAKKRFIRNRDKNEKIERKSPRKTIKRSKIDPLLIPPQSYHKKRNRTLKSRKPKGPRKITIKHHPDSDFWKSDSSDPEDERFHEKPERNLPRSKYYQDEDFEAEETMSEDEKEYRVLNNIDNLKKPLSLHKRKLAYESNESESEDEAGSRLRSSSIPKNTSHIKTKKAMVESTESESESEKKKQIGRRLRAISIPKKTSHNKTEKAMVESTDSESEPEKEVRSRLRDRSILNVKTPVKTEKNVAESTESESEQESSSRLKRVITPVKTKRFVAESTESESEEVKSQSLRARKPKVYSSSGITKSYIEITKNNRNVSRRGAMRKCT